jgi:hypothetical protein
MLRLWPVFTVCSHGMLCYHAQVIIERSGDRHLTQLLMFKSDISKTIVAVPLLLLAGISQP